MTGMTGMAQERFWMFIRVYWLLSIAIQQLSTDLLGQH